MARRSIRVGGRVRPRGGPGPLGVAVLVALGGLRRDVGGGLPTAFSPPWTVGFHRLHLRLCEKSLPSYSFLAHRKSFRFTQWPSMSHQSAFQRLTLLLAAFYDPQSPSSPSSLRLMWVFHIASNVVRGG